MDSTASEPPARDPLGVARLPSRLPQRLLKPVATMAGVVLAFAYVGAVDPNQPGHYPPCPLFRLTGIYCPGCGGLRAAHAVAHGDIAAALGLNALAVVGFALFLAGWTVWLYRSARGRPFEITPRRGQGWAVAVVLAVFMIIRNLPFGAALAP